MPDRPPEHADPSSDDPASLVRRATVLYSEGQLLQGLRVSERLIQQGAATPEIWCATGNALHSLGEYAQAVRAFQRCLTLRTDYFEAEHGFAQALFALGNADAAAARLESVAERTGAIASWQGLATIIPGCPHADHSRIRAVRTRFAQELAASQGGERAASSLAQGRPRIPGKRLKIGYLSAFFDKPNYMKPVWGLLNHHERSRFELHLFSDAPRGEWSGYQPHPDDQIHHIAALSNEHLTAAIRDCAIDILVDLNGYSARERLALFLDRPAPLNVAWFNLYATSGLPGFDYIVGDDEVVAPEEEQFYTERVWRVPCSYLTFDVQHAAPPVMPPPCTKRDYLTFGSLVAQYKITPPVMDAWAQILQQAPSARLLLANTALKSEENRRYIAEQFAVRGIAAERLDLCGPAEHYAFLQYYDRMDLALDAFPYSGGTTTMEALWQGVPVITVDGDRWAARTSQTLLRRTHLAEFVAGSVAAMVDLAAGLARSADAQQRLGVLRCNMRTQLQASPACDTAALARAMEQFYRSITNEPGV